MRWIYLAIVVLIAAATLVFAFQNLQPVAVSFLASTINPPLALLVFVVYVLGAATGGSLYALLRRSVRGSQTGRPLGRGRRPRPGVLRRASGRTPVFRRAMERARQAASAPSGDWLIFSPCARWFSGEPASGSRSRSGRPPNRDRARSACGSKPAASAAPTCTWSTANCRTRSCRSSPATRSSAGSKRPAKASTCRLGRASACRGSAMPAAIAPTAEAPAKISAIRRSSPATPATAVSPPIRSPTRPSPFRSTRRSTRSRRRRCSAPA